VSLEKEIFNAYVESMGGADKMDDLAKKSLQTLSSKLSNAFIDWITNQTFRVVEMEAPIKIESIRTSNEIEADISEDVTYTKTNLETGQDETLTLSNTSKAIKIPKLDLKSAFGQGGTLDVIGNVKFKQTNYKTSSRPNTETSKNVVKLFKGEVKK
jgi:hypothetical protein